MYLITKSQVQHFIKKCLVMVQNTVLLQVVNDHLIKGL